MFKMAASCVLLGLMLLHGAPLLLVRAQSYRNLTSGSPAIVAGDTNTYLLSPSGEFGFGFKDMGSGFLLAIWFEKIDLRTVVWSANGDNLAPQGSKVQLTKDGRMLLDDPSGLNIWSVHRTGSGLVYAALLNSGI
ncbi:hypothetical protein MLD38_017141 [Melastoma candidum]|uniref:Uncharacterized protein n=1 Tax=Melastoma candidum TaxID=119954 RepID=A0ACB9QT61_9MYRT|nr:hypothetical protein MLD38_017141 [Melastoma candidum]